MSNIKKIVIGLIAFIVITPMVALGYFYFKLNSIYDKDTAKEIDDKIEKVDESNGITNILLIGVDGENLDKGDRAGSTMIITIDENIKSIRLTSISRDTLVEIPEHGEGTVCESYTYGGPTLLLQTIDKNFGVKIDKYASFSYESFPEIIDIVGGIDVSIKPKEVEFVPGIDKAGNQTLDGEQAIEYSWITFDGDYERDERQRIIIEATYNKLMDNFTSNFMEVGEEIFKHAKTNMTPTEIISLANKVIAIEDTHIAQMEFPMKNYREVEQIDDEQWIINWDKDYNKDQLNKFIYDYHNYRH